MCVVIAALVPAIVAQMMKWNELDAVQKWWAFRKTSH